MWDVDSFCLRLFTMGVDDGSRGQGPKSRVENRGGDTGADHGGCVMMHKERGEV